MTEHKTDAGRLPEIALPDLDPTAPYVELRAMQCRACGEMGPAVNTADKHDPNHLWDSHHADATGHHRFYAWTLSRGTAWSGRI